MNIFSYSQVVPGVASIFPMSLLLLRALLHFFQFFLSISLTTLKPKSKFDFGDFAKCVNKTFNAKI